MGDSGLKVPEILTLPNPKTCSFYISDDPETTYEGPARPIKVELFYELHRELDVEQLQALQRARSIIPKAVIRYSGTLKEHVYYLYGEHGDLVEVSDRIITLYDAQISTIANHTSGTEITIRARNAEVSKAKMEKVRPRTIFDTVEIIDSTSNSASINFENNPENGLVIEHIQINPESVNKGAV